VAVDRLKVRSCLIDGEAVACDKNGLAVFERLRLKPAGDHVFFLYAFDLLELNGTDLRREPIETRKATLASLLRGSLAGLRLNEHLAHDGESRHACKMGLVRMRQFAKVAALSGTRGCAGMDLNGLSTRQSWAGSRP
jgi:bifunctional non-homologous end joining protein LigD